MDTSHPSFVIGFAKQCALMGLDLDTTMSAFRLHELNENLQDPDFRRGFKKRAETGSLLDTLKRLGTGAKEQWGKLDTAQQGAVLGAGAGGLGGLVFGGKNRLRNALLGALLGGGAGHFIGNRIGSRIPAFERDGKARHFARETDPALWKDLLTQSNVPSPIDTEVDRFDRRRAAGEEVYRAGDTPLQATWNRRYHDMPMLEMLGTGRKLREMGTPSPVKDPMSWAAK